MIDTTLKDEGCVTCGQAYDLDRRITELEQRLIGAEKFAQNEHELMTKFRNRAVRAEVIIKRVEDIINASSIMQPRDTISRIYAALAGEKPE